MLTLGIETSCDETSASVVEDAQKVLSNVVASSLTQHVRYGGIIPEIASRAQLESICFVVDEALKKAKVSHRDLDLVAVTQGPGLIGSLLVGHSFARALSIGWKLPLVGINHVRAHLYAAFIENKISFPFVGLVVSGGHTSLYKVNSLSHEEVLGTTRDDAAGEAFDKVAKILGLGYPGGPPIEKLALQGQKKSFPFRCTCGPGLDFSFSGIKTAVLYKVNELKKMYRTLPRLIVADLCASFQEAVVSDLVLKSMRAIERSKAKTLVVGGGVAFNGYLREQLQRAASRYHVRLFIAPKEYCLDNAAMVASFASRLFKMKGHRTILMRQNESGCFVSLET
jgi:N6-L-threonylcarbamoyladenine synthase